MENHGLIQSISATLWRFARDRKIQTNRRSVFGRSAFQELVSAAIEIALREGLLAA